MNKRHKKRRQRRLSIILIIIALVLIAGCGIFYLVGRSGDDEAAEAISNQTSTNTEADLNITNNETKDNVDANTDDDSTLTFEDLSKYSFSFYSGAGGWSDDFNIEKDGYFHGHYHDSDMGDSGDDYPDGTYYFSDYEGHFKNIQKIDEYTYEMTVKDLKVLNGNDEYIEDGIKYVPLTPYALEEANKVQIYMPGKPVSEIDEEVQTWLFISYQEQQDRLDNLALVNVNENLGITSCERMSPKEEAESSYDATKNSYDYYNEKLQDAETTVDMVEVTSSQVKVTDNCLNDIWRLVKYNTDEATFNKALEEQRQWLKDRDAQAAKDSAEYEGGTFASVAYNDTFASMTIKRCEELLKYFK